MMDVTGGAVPTNFRGNATPSGPARFGAGTTSFRAYPAVVMVLRMLFTFFRAGGTNFSTQHHYRLSKRRTTGKKRGTGCADRCAIQAFFHTGHMTCIGHTDTFSSTPVAGLHAGEAGQYCFVH